MSIVDCACGMGNSRELNFPAKQPLHRLAAVRRLQGMSRRTIARRLNVDAAEIRRQEEETADLPLSVLYQWHRCWMCP